MLVLRYHENIDFNQITQHILIYVLFLTVARDWISLLGLIELLGAEWSLFFFFPFFPFIVLPVLSEMKCRFKI